MPATPRHSKSTTGPASWPAVTDDELQALDEIVTSGEWSLGGQDIKITNLDKIMFPGDDSHDPVTKRDVIRHYASVAPAMLPYLAGRPVNVQRFPEGIAKAGFWQKAAPKHTPDWITQWHNTEAAKGRTEYYLVLDSPASLVWIANYGAIEIHPWTSTTRDVHEPTWAMIDIDPGTETSHDDLLELVRLHRVALDDVGVTAAPKVSGKRGIQIWVPIADGYTFEDTTDWVEQLSLGVGRHAPDLISWEWELAKRGGRARLDFTQNSIGKTLVAPFSIRPAPGAPVSVPIAWDEVGDPDVRPDRWDITSIGARLVEAGDPMAALIGEQQRLPDLGGGRPAAAD